MSFLWHHTGFSNIIIFSLPIGLLQKIKGFLYLHVFQHDNLHKIMLLLYDSLQRRHLQLLAGRLKRL